MWQADLWVPECPDSGDQKAVLSAQRKKKSVIHKQNKETLPISAMDYSKESRPSVHLRTTINDDPWGRETASVFNKISSETLFLAIQANSPIAVKACVPYLYAILLDNFKS